MITKRQEKIISKLSENYITGSTLAKIFGVSDRTIRTDISKINEHFSTNVIDSNKRYGYKILDPVTVSRELNVKEEVMDVNNRFQYILKKLLIEEQGINLVKLQSELYISEATIENDIRRVKEMIGEYHRLSLKRDKQHLTLLGDEEQKRRLYKKLLLIETKGNFSNLNQLDELYRGVSLVEIHDILVESMERLECKLREIELPMIIMHLAVSIERINKCNYTSNDKMEQNIEESVEFQLATEVYNKINKKYMIYIPDSEIRWFAIFLLGKRSTGFIDKNNESEKIILEIYKEIKERFDVDLSQDESLQASFKLHIEGLLDRLSSGKASGNVFLKEIKRRYPLIFEMSLYASKLIENLTGYSMNEDESGFIALHLGSSYEKLNNDSVLKAVLILPYNQNVIALCKSKIDAVFSDKMEITNIVSMFEKFEIDRIDPDLIITTVDISGDIGYEYVRISMFVDPEDESAIFKAINSILKQRSKLQFNLSISSLIQEDLFYYNLEAETPEEVITFMCDELCHRAYVEEDFKENVLKREKMSPTAFANQFAVPHAFDKLSNKQAISVAILKKSIKWGNFNTKLVILFAMDDKDQSLLRIFFDWITATSSDTEKFLELLDCKTYKEFIEKIVD